MSQRPQIFERVLVACVIATILIPAILRAEEPDAEIITQVATGVGVDEQHAEVEALRDAVQQAAGSIISAETLVKNDELIRDKVLIYSSGIVKTHEVVGSPTKTDGGLVRVTVRAQVERRELIKRLEGASISVTNVDGGNLLARWEAQLKNTTDGIEIFRTILNGVNPRILRAEVAGEPRIIKADPTDVLVGVTVHFSVDPEKYKQWREASAPYLRRLAVDSADFEWGPGKGLLQTLAEVQADAHGLLGHYPLSQLRISPESRKEDADCWGYASMSESDMGKSLAYPYFNMEAKHWWPEQFHHPTALIVVDRFPRGTARIYAIPQELFAALVPHKGGEDEKSTTPKIRIRLCDGLGTEIYSTEASTLFEDDLHRWTSIFSATSVWFTDRYRDGVQNMLPMDGSRVVTGMLAEETEHASQFAWLVMPALAARGPNTATSHGIMAGFNYEFRLNLAKNDWTRVKRIEVEVLQGAAGQAVNHPSP